MQKQLKCTLLYKFVIRGLFSLHLLLICTVALAQNEAPRCNDPNFERLLRLERWESLQEHISDLIKQNEGNQQAELKSIDIVCKNKIYGSVLGEKEQFQNAILILKDTIDYANKKLGVTHAYTLASEFSLATVYVRQGKYDIAIPAYRILLPKFEKTYGKNSWDVAILLKNTSIALDYVGNQNDALTYDQRALKIANELNCTDLQLCKRIKGEANATIAHTLVRLNRFDEARIYSIRSIELLNETRGKNHIDTLNARLTYASILGRQGHNSEAREIQRDVVQIANQQFGETHPMSRKAQGELAASSLTTKDRIEAVESEVKKLLILKSQLGTNHPLFISTSRNVIQHQMELGLFSEALLISEAAINALFLRSDTLLFDDRTLNSWMNEQDKLIGIHINLLARARKFTDAFLLTEHAKYSSLSLSLNGASLPKLDSNSKHLMSQLRQKLNLIDQKIAIARSLNQNIDNLNAERAQEFIKWSNNSKSINSQAPSTKLLPEWSLKIINLKETVVSYRFVDKFLYVFTFNGNNTTAQVIDNQDRIRPTVEAYRLAMRHAAIYAHQPNAAPPIWRLANGTYRYSEQAPTNDAQRVGNPNDILRDLSHLLLKDVLPKIGNQSRLLISIDQNLGHVPFDSLPIDGGLLGERFTVGMLPSFALYDTLEARQSNYSKLERKPLLAVGGAHYARFEKTSPLLTIQREREITVTPMDMKIMWQAVNRDRSKLPLAFLQFTQGQSDLPGSLAEVEAIAKTYDAGSSQKSVVLTGELASEESINRLAGSGELERFKILHFSTHGFLSDDEPALSAIVLSQVNRAAGTDGYLTSAEISSMNLQSDLVIVSACDSGASEKLAGAGAAGLSFALFQAGSISSFLTLWPIPDQDSRRFMERFYIEVKAGNNTSISLQKTKAWARQNKISNHVTQGFVMWGI